MLSAQRLFPNDPGKGIDGLTLQARIIMRCNQALLVPSDFPGPAGVSAQWRLKERDDPDQAQYYSANGF